ncbi:MAG: glycosyltransferase [Alsobacter sp.]
MPDPGRLSIAMATFNGARYLENQLASLAVQSRRPDELVVCDDGSSDATVALVRSFARQAPFPVELVCNEDRLGYRHNFVKAGRLCSGDIVFFCDQDDEWLPGKIETMAAAFDDPAVMLAYHNALVVDEDGQVLFDLYEDQAQSRSNDPLHQEPFRFSLGFTQAYRRSLHRFDDLLAASIDHVSEQPDCMAHDQWYFFLAQMLGGVSYVPARLVRYRQHGANAFGVKPESPADATASQKIRSLFVAPVWSAGALSESARARGRIATAIAGQLTGPEADAVRQWADQYGALGERLRRRQVSCYGSTLVERWSALLRNVAGGAYAGRDLWHFQRPWLLGDALRAIVASRPQVASYGSATVQGRGWR